MHWFIQLSLELRLLWLAIIGLVCGAFANYLIYSWAYFPRHISPFAPPHAQAPPRHWSDRIPIWGWFGLRREVELHGPGFWIRPLLIEITMPLALIAIYWFETQSGGLLPEIFRNGQSISKFSPWAHGLFFVHAVMFVLMTAATFIDFDEQTIPDIITTPGTWFALVVSMLPWSTWLPGEVFWNGQLGMTETTFNVPWPFEDKWLGGLGLVTALAIWWTWCFSLLERHLVLRRGLKRAIGYFCHGVRRSTHSKWIGLMAAVGSCVVAGAWLSGGEPFRGLLTSLIGLAVGGGAVWAVRIVASSALRQEAMGFGDVTLMAMIGAAVGWQCALLAFFLAPFTAIVIVLVQYALTRQAAIPFGPYLCAGTMVTIYGWDVIWNRTASQYVLLGSTLLGVLVTALVAMGIMLLIWRPIKARLFA